MGRRASRNILTGIEIGTTTIKVVMGEFLPDDVLALVGYGAAPSLKVVKGEVVDADVVREQLERAVLQAEQASGLEITGDIFLAVTGSHIQTVNSVGSTLIHHADRRIREEDAAVAAKSAHGYQLPPDRQVLHYCDRFYRIDDHREVLNAAGLAGARLEADVHLIYGRHNRLETACGMVADVMGYPATDIAFSGVAGAFAAFAPEDVEKGSLLIDIGAGVTEYIVFQGAGCFHSGQVTIGCEHLANDIAVGLNLPHAKARSILREFAQLGSCVMTPDGRNRVMEIEVLGHKPRRVPVSSMERILELRLQELFEVILADLERHNAQERIGGGVKIAGGGALLPDITRLAQHVMHMPVTIAKPRLLSGKEEIISSPAMVTPVGLLRWGRLALQIAEPREVSFWSQFGNDLRRLWSLMRDSFRW